MMEKYVVGVDDGSAVTSVPGVPVVVSEAGVAVNSAVAVTSGVVLAVGVSETMARDSAGNSGMTNSVGVADGVGEPFG